MFDQHETKAGSRDAPGNSGVVAVDLPDVTQVSEAIQAIRTAPPRLVLLVGPAGSGKTRHLAALTAEHGYPRIAISATLSEQLRPLPKRRRPTHIHAIVSDLIAGVEGDIVLLDNIELVFLPELEQDPLQLLENLARNRTLCVAWPGRLDTDGSLVYAELGHPEYQRYRDHRIQCIAMPGTL